MSYDIGGGYDGWKTATPWDDEVEVTVSFDCSSCDEPNDDVDAVTGKRDSEVIVYCEHCGKENSVDGSDW